MERDSGRRRAARGMISSGGRFTAPLPRIAKHPITAVRYVFEQFDHRLPFVAQWAGGEQPLAKGGNMIRKQRGRVKCLAAVKARKLPVDSIAARIQVGKEFTDRHQLPATATDGPSLIRARVQMGGNGQS